MRYAYSRLLTFEDSISVPYSLVKYPPRIPDSSWIGYYAGDVCMVAFPRVVNGHRASFVEDTDTLVPAIR